MFIERLMTSAIFFKNNQVKFKYGDFKDTISKEGVSFCLIKRKSTLLREKKHHVIVQKNGKYF